MPPTESRARKTGRPPRQRAAATRDELLDKAIDVFVRRGIQAATLRDIATEAGVTPAMLHYHFGDKQGLVGAVVEERVLAAIGALHAELGRPEDVAGLMGTFARAAMAIGHRHPWLPSLWVREVLSEGGALRHVLVERVAPMIPRRIAERFSDAQSRGELDARLDPRLLVVNLIGLTLFPLAAAPIWRQIFSADDIDEPAITAHTLALIGKIAETSP
ncbi:MAG: TetR/AcrR family transcriptional regulator [Xanthomonadales bacterium]|nr:TetR/AcrR family transcriptional regulator [Xanthomonadales bacterium]